jgi:hypothetical protein
MNLKNFYSLYEPASRGLLEKVAREKGLNLALLPNYRFPREDYHLNSERYPIFAVADGVTLEFENYLSFPEFSGAGEAARIFCQTAIEEAEGRYENFGVEEIREVFNIANAAVGRYNAERGRTKETSNFWNFDLYCSTAAFAVVKGGVVYWGTICDSYLARVDCQGKIIFQTPECWAALNQNLPVGWKEKSVDDRKRILRSVYRNGTDKNGRPIGYGVVNGEPSVCLYLNVGSFVVEEGETVLLFTDGFEEHVKNSKFIRLVQGRGVDLLARLQKFNAEIAPSDYSKFGHERSIIVLQF